MKMSLFVFLFPTITATDLATDLVATLSQQQRRLRSRSKVSYILCVYRSSISNGDSQAATLVEVHMVNAGTSGLWPQFYRPQICAIKLITSDSATIISDESVQRHFFRLLLCVLRLFRRHYRSSSSCVSSAVVCLATVLFASSSVRIFPVMLWIFWSFAKILQLQIAICSISLARMYSVHCCVWFSKHCHYCWH